MPDHRVRLTPEGHQQALEAGRKLRALLRPDDTLHFFTSPYRRTRETTEGILASLTNDDPTPSPFPRHTIKVYEEPRLREQDFGNFQPCSAEMERMWQERADYGHFFYRIPNGESAADAYDRISGFNDSLWRRFEETDFASVCILVTHGLMTRVFLMKWYHFSVEYFEDLRNVNHCEFVVMKRSPDGGKFILQNQLRTWSELKRERAARGSVSQANHATTPGAGDSPIPPRRRWGGCPDGCGHAPHNHEPRVPEPIRQNTADLFKGDDEFVSSLPKDSSRPSGQDSINLDDTRSAPRSCPQARTDNGDGANSDGKSLPANEDTILDQDPNKFPSPTSSPLRETDRPFTHRLRKSQTVPTPLDQSLLEEVLSPNSRGEDDLPTPRPFPSQLSSNQDSSNVLSSNNGFFRRAKPHRPRREAELIAMVGRDGGGSLSGAASSDEEAIEQQDSLDRGGDGAGDEISADDEYDCEEDEEEAFPEPNTTTSLSSLPQQDQQLRQSESHSQPKSIPRTRSSLAKALKGEHIHLHNPSLPRLSTSTSALPISSDRAMADALGDQSDAEVTEDDEEILGIRKRQRGEEERILAQERKEWEKDKQGKKDAQQQVHNESEEREKDEGVSISSVRQDVY